MMNPSQHRAFVVVIVLVGAALSGTACKRACESADNCVRTCSCLDSITDDRVDCPIAFRCDEAKLECESDFDALSCDDICQQYAAVGKCGFERCNSDADCFEAVSCPVFDANGQPTGLTFQCTLPFTCGQADGLCQQGSELADEQLCASQDCQAQRP